MVDNEEEVKPEVVEKKEVDKQYWFKIILASFIGIIWLVLLILRFTTDISLYIPTIISIVLTVIGAVALFGKQISDKFKGKTTDDSKIPEAISKEQVYDILDEEMERMMNHRKSIGGIEWVKTDDINKNNIYTFKVNLLYNESFGSQCYVIINANYPDKQATIIPATVSDNYLTKAINAKSSNPKDDPDVEVTELENPFTGMKSISRRTSHYKRHRRTENKEAVV